MQARHGRTVRVQPLYFCKFVESTRHFVASIEPYVLVFWHETRCKAMIAESSDSDGLTREPKPERGPLALDLLFASDYEFFRPRARPRRPLAGLHP